MKAYEVVTSPTADAHLTEINDHIAEEASAPTATRFLERIERRIVSLAHFPERGTLREDLGRGVRTFGVSRRVTIVFRVEKRARRVVVLGVFYAGRQVRLE